MNRSIRIALGIVVAAFIPCGMGSAIAQSHLPTPNPRPMVAFLDLAKLSAKPIPLYCIFMRVDGSQFASSMQLSFSVRGAGQQSNAVRLQIDDQSLDLPSGAFTGVAKGIPLMDEEIFDLHADGKDGYQQKQFRLAIQFSIDDAGKPSSIAYRATILRSKEDMVSATAVGFCYMKDTIQILSKVTK